MHTCRHLDIQAYRHTRLHFARHCTSIIPTRLACLQPMTQGLLIQAKPETRHLTHWPRSPRRSALKAHKTIHKMLHAYLLLLFQMVTDPIKQDNANIAKPTRRAHANYLQHMLPCNVSQELLSWVSWQEFRCPGIVWSMTPVSHNMHCLAWWDL